MSGPDSEGLTSLRTWNRNGERTSSKVRAMSDSCGLKMRHFVSPALYVVSLDCTRLRANGVDGYVAYATPAQIMHPTLGVSGLSALIF